MGEKNKEINDLKKLINSNKSSIDGLTKKLNELNESVEKIKIHRGERKVSEFEIKSKVEWDLVERTLLQKGIILEHEIFKSLEEMGIEYEPNDSFFYPTDKGFFYIDSFFSNNNPFQQFENALEVKTKLNETDVWIHDREIIQDDNFTIKFDVNYFIECKSRSNPPINYLFVIDKDISKTKTKRKSFFTIKGSKSIGDLFLGIDYFWRTNHDPIQISYPNLNLEETKTLITAFWQLFKRIDCNKNDMINFMFYNYWEYEEIEVPDGFELPQEIELFSTFYNKMKKNNLIPKKLKENIITEISIFVPIIVVNSNIYSIDLDPEIDQDFIDRVKKAPGFIKEFSYLKQGKNEGHKFTDLTSFVMAILQQNGICFKDTLLLSNLFEPILDIFVISSSEFSTYFEKIRNQIKDKFLTKIKAMKDGIFLGKKEELLRFQVLKWMLYHSNSLRYDLINLWYEEYKIFKESNLRLI